MKIQVGHRGDFKNTENFLKQVTNLDIALALHKYGVEGVAALDSSTPEDSGVTASSWTYKVSVTKNVYTISWHNNNIVDGVPLVILLQYGHGTRNGGYVQGRDFINPAIQPIFERIAADVWNEVRSA